MDQLATIGGDKGKEGSKDSAEASPSEQHEEELQLHENSEEMTPNKDDNEASKENVNENQEKISAYVNNEESVLMEESSHVNGDQDEDNIESGDSQREPGGDNDVMLHPYEGKCPNNEASVLMDESSDVNSGDQDEYNIESSESQKESSDDKNVMPGHPFEGKRVRVKGGALAGLTAPIRAVKLGGWIVLDHPDATKAVAQRRCEFLDKITLEEVKNYHQGLGRPFRLTPSAREQIRRSGRKRSRKARTKEGYEFESKKRNANLQINDIYSHSGPRLNELSDELEEGYEFESKKCNANPLINDIYSHSDVRLNELSDAAQTAFPRPSVFSALNVQTRQPEMLNYESADRPQRVPRPLPPILLEATKKHELPQSLRHLDPNTRVDIFNRKTGKIMSGAQAIHVKDLPEALLLHSEYEPIVPPPASRNDSTFTREGRSARNVRVSNSVLPQSRLEVSHYRGRSAVVIKGSYRGYIGVIDECTPGGWYVLKDVYHRAELGFPLVVGPDHIEFIPTSCEAMITEMSHLVKDYNFQNMVTTYQDYLTQHFSGLLQPLTDRIETLSVEESYLTHILHQCQSETDEFSRTPEEVERIRSRLRTVREWKLAAEKEQHELLKQSASARAYALHTFEGEEKAEASKELSSMQLDADTKNNEPTTKPASLPEIRASSTLTPPFE